MRSIEKSQAGKKEKTDTVVNEKAVDPSIVGPIIADLLDLLESDLVEARRRMEDLAGHLTNSKFGQPFNMLEKQMDNFDLPAASDTLKAIAEELSLSLGED
jgi:hypothetical protein